MQDLHKSDNQYFPKLITKNSDHELKIIWDDEKECIYDLRELRFACQCALCRHEITKEQLIKFENIPHDIKVLKAELVGNYALHFTWSDNHTTGIYSYEYLRKLCQ